ncbi:MAG: pyridine nucleotide-disulfide oxidoreductase, partial [Wenzhouxiangella sp.]
MKNRLLKLLEEQNADVLPDPGRRRLLQASGLGVAGLAAGGTLLSPAPARAVQTSARIVIVGGGAAGLSAANRLASGLSG